MGLPESLTSLLRSQSINGTLYLLAREPFDTTRIMVRSETEGRWLSSMFSRTCKADSHTLPDVQILLDSEPDTDAAESLSNTKSLSWGMPHSLAMPRNNSTHPHD